MNICKSPKCENEVIPREYRGGTAKKYCCNKCRRYVNSRNYFLRYPEKQRALISKYAKTQKGKDAYEKRKQNPEFKKKLRARRKLQYAVLAGYLEKPNKCSKCGGFGINVVIEGHHYKGYDFPLDVEWLCVICHTE